MSTQKPVALVTGASSGIGAEFARALAARDHDLVVVARDASRLDALAEQLEREHGVDVEVLSADLTSKKGRAVVEARLESAEPTIDLLVNNAGMGTYGKFVELSREGEAREIRLNVLALVQLSHAALSGMTGRGRGGIINVSSLAGHQPTPLNATYGATKAFVTSFSQALHEELRGTGVKVMVLCPGFTRTEFQARAGLDSGSVPSFLWQTPEPVVAAALRAYEQGRAVCIPGALNQAGAAFSSALPAGITRRIAGAVVPRVE
jgi:short-subunit dehydrogenase